MSLLKTKFFQNPIIKKPLLFIHTKSWLFLARVLNDKIYIKFKFLIRVGYLPNLKKPRTFQEKLQWIKLNDRKEIYHQMVDKLKVKDFIAQRLGEGYTFPTIGIWNSFDKIDFDNLPNKFVLKCTHDSGSYFICQDKSTLDKEDARKKLLVNFKKDYYIKSREFPYKGLTPRIIAEPLIQDNKYPDLRDFKFMCFNGEPKLFYITSNNQKRRGYNIDYFDLQGNHLKIEKSGNPNNVQNRPSIPEKLKEMITIAKKLAKNTYFLRVDFYEVDYRIYVGELTFFDFAGFGKFKPENYNKILGDWIELPQNLLK